MPRARMMTHGQLVMLGAFLAACADDPPPAETPRHVILIVVDTLRADHLTPYGYKRDTSPRLVEFAREALLFENCVSQGSFTSPSMVSLMTSSYLGEEPLKIPEDRATIAEVFQKAGWTTGAFVFNDVLNVDCRFHRGFDSYQYKDSPYGSDAAIEAWLQANRDARTFTWIHLNEAHDPYGPFDGKWPKDAPARFVERADSLALEQRRWLADYAAERALSDAPEHIERIGREIGAYDDDVAYSDGRLGRIFDAIRAAGLWDRSAIVIAADHGEGLWTRELYLTGTRLKAWSSGEPATLLNSLHPTHGSQVNWELVHVPLLVKAPGLVGGSRVDATVQNVDIAPTLFELCDLPLPNAVHGQSLLALARPEADPRAWRPAYSTTRFASTLIDQDGWQLVHPTDNGKCAFGLVDELFDLRSDPEARANLASEHPDRVERMKAEIRRRLSSGIRKGDEELGAETIASLNGLGYIESGVVESLQKLLQDMSTQGLLKDLANQGSSCLLRLEIVRALSRRTLSDQEQQALRDQLERESMVDVRAALRQLVAKW